MRKLQEETSKFEEEQISFKPIEPVVPQAV